MNLPMLVTPTYVDVIPSTKQKVEYRPFLVKEEKILLMALEGNDREEIIRTVEQIFNNCIKTEGIDFKNLASFDFEYLMLKLRSKSVGEVVELNFRHNEDDCGELNSVEVNLDDIEVKFNDDHKDIVMITDEVGVKMKYPTIVSIESIDLEEENNIKNVFDIFVNSIDYVFDKDNVYSDYSKEDLIEFVENLNQAQFDKISNFFETMPKLKHEIKFKCKKCEKEVTTEVQGLQSFFT
jgi:hypothetical protein